MVAGGFQNLRQRRRELQQLCVTRPDQRTPLPCFLLAGDYTRGDYPATLEGAVRSGLRCAALLQPV